MDYLERAGLTEPLQQLGFYLVGYGCTTCIGNSGPLLRRRHRGRQGRRPLGGLGAVGQPELRGTHPPRRADELPGVAARWSWPTPWPGRWTSTSPPTPSATDADGSPVLLADLWPSHGGGEPRPSGPRSPPTCSAPATARSSTATSYWQAGADGRGRDLRVAGRLHLREEPALLRGHDHDAGPGHRHRRRPGAGHAGRQRHHRPHLPGRLHRPDHARPAATWPSTGVAAPGLQLLRGPPGQPRGDDAGHLRQRPAAQPAGARHRGRRAPCTCPTATETIHLRSRHAATPPRASRSSCWPARSTASGSSAATGRPRAPPCSASGP